MRFVVSIHCLSLLIAFGVIAGEPSKIAPGFGPPLIPPAKSPVDSFRELLDMKPADRTNALAKKSEKYRKVIEERLQEFDALPLDQRQARLRLMQLRWELLPLLQNNPANRTLLINLVPEPDRLLIKQRLEYWDKLSPEIQGLILTNEMVLHYFITGQGTTTTVSTNTLPPTIATNMNLWRELTPYQQRQAYENFREVFGLGEKDREKLFAENLLLGRSPAQRERIEKLLKSFENLPPDQREKRMKSFEKFTSMTMAQRIQFLQNAERWEKMPESQKNLYRQMPPIPPLPPSFFSPPVVTNVSLSTNQ